MLKFSSVKSRYPFIIGVVSALSVGLIMYFLGNFSGYESRGLLEQTLGYFGTLFNTVALGCATILALLLTALGRSKSINKSFKSSHYDEISNLASLNSFAFIISMFSFIFLIVPFTESSNLSSGFYKIIYWLILIDSSILIGMTITIGLTLRKLIIKLVITSVKDKN